MATNNAINAPLPLAVTQGGTGRSTLTNHSLLVGAGTGAITQLGSALNGQIPIGSTGVDPVLATITAGTSITVTNGPGSITISASNASNVQFSALLSSFLANFCGDGVEETVVCDTVLYNDGGGYNNGTGIFTAPQDGTYIFNGYVSLSPLLVGHTFAYTKIITIVPGFPQFEGALVNPFAIRQQGSPGNQRYAMDENAIVHLSAGDTVSLIVNVGTSTKTVTLEGISGTQVSTIFSGKLLNPS